MSNPRNTELRFDAFKNATAKTAKGYEILVVHAGLANGWNFSKPVLQDAVRLWNGVECFADHNMFGESVHDLAGVFSNPRWDETREGIVADLRPTGPAADLLRAYAEEMLGDDLPHPDLGFSPVLVFTSNGEDVTSIIRVRSEDLVIKPAFKTQFLSATFKRSYAMPPEKEETKTDAAPSGENLEEHVQAMRELTGAQSQINDAVKGARETHLTMCQNLLDTSLDAASVDLPESALTLIRSRFKDRTFKPTELKAEIDAFKEAFTQQTAAASIVGPAQVTGMFNRADQLQAAFDDMLDAPREKGSEGLRVHRFSGVKEAYLMLTGDYGFVGHVEPRLAKFQGSTETFPNLVANALNKALVKYWNQYGAAGYNWWESIATVESFESLHDIKWLRLGTIASLPVVPEGDDYPELKLGDNGESSVFYKHGGFLSFTLEALDKDDTRKLRAAPRELALAARRNISEQIAAIFTVNSGAGPTLADGGYLFNATAVTTAGGHANLLTTALGTDYTAWEAVAAAMYNQPMLVTNETADLGTGKKQAMDPKYILVPRALRGAANNLFVTRQSGLDNKNVENLYYGQVFPLTVPEWSDTNNFAAVLDPMLMPGVMIGTRYGLIPQIIVAGDQNSPAMFTNDESRLKLRHFVATGVSGYASLHKSNVA